VSVIEIEIAMKLIYRILNAILDRIIGPQGTSHETPIDCDSSGDCLAIPSTRDGREAAR
jgi:hypothetical protein